MSAQPSDPSAESPSSLRAALLAPPAPPTAAAPPVATEAPTAAPASTHEAAVLPTAGELLAASPNLARLCESYHTTRRKMIERGRRQRLGIAALVCAAGVGAGILVRQGSLPRPLGTLTVVAVAVSSLVGLAVLATLWLRDERKLRHAQGERLLRALQFNCSLPEESLRAFRRLAQPTAAFFEVYAAWRAEHPDTRNALQIMLQAVSGGGRKGAASA